MDKSALAAALLAELRLRYDRAVAALSGAREAATGADTKAENKYDTRGLEASYLAAGQAEQADELLRAIHAVEAFSFRDFDFDDPIDLGALVEIEQDGEPRHYPSSPRPEAYHSASEDGAQVTVLGPASPLAARLIGTSSGTILNDQEPELLVLDLF